MYLGIAYDALRLMGLRAEDFYMNIKPQGGYSGLISGPAFTTYGMIVDGCDEVAYKELDDLRLYMYKPELFANRPIVVLAANDNVVAHSGDITSTIYQKLGAVGFVTDGNVRDIELIDELGFPTFCKDVNPIDAIHYWALTGWQTPVIIEGVLVFPGDQIIASKDGVVRVPYQRLDEFSVIVNEQLARENKVRARLQDPNIDFFKLVEEMGRW